MFLRINDLDTVISISVESFLSFESLTTHIDFYFIEDKYVRPIPYRGDFSMRNKKLLKALKEV
jgi:hypothetical protein